MWLLRRWILKSLYPVNAWFGSKHLPFIHKKIKAKHYREVQKFIKPGMIFLAKRFGEASNLAIPGDWPHAAIVRDKNTIIEAVGIGVIRTDMIDFMLSRDELLILEPTFASEQDMQHAANWADTKVGDPYDFLFETNNKAFYCAELCYDAYDDTMEIPEEFLVNREFTLGELTYIPSHMANNKIAWKIKWDSRAD